MPKGSCLSPSLLDLLNTFEEALAGRQLMPADRGDVLSLSWMRYAMESLSTTHADIRILITALSLHASDWDNKRIDVYLDNSIKLLGIFIVFSSKIYQLKEELLNALRCILHDLKSASHDKYVTTHLLEEWRQHITGKNPRLENSNAKVMDIRQRDFRLLS
uniref:Uncharacterized protein n=1 Tax=Utricularia reniformis TaxID=192314 RepID=A0A1Y0B0W4_9LAMI|nr:hypothetical protein AEK19_MT0786 [Utricularia reniformis]ART31027.1 hypothetical protein AEK19_MT0786 [Utricularia reniformis]